MPVSDESSTITHDFPAWHDKADFVLAYRLTDAPAPWKWEQLWAHQLAVDRFLICCIPFFIYGLSLGDVVSTRPREGRKYVVDRMLESGGHFTYRLWYPGKTEWHEVVDHLTMIGCTVEVRWEHSGLIAIDSPAATIRAEVEAYLNRLEASNPDVTWEGGV